MKMCVFFPWSLVARSALESLLTRARALGLAAHLTDRFCDIEVAADLSQLANELQRLPKKAPRTAYGAEEPRKDPLLMLSFEYSPVYLLAGLLLLGHAQDEAISGSAGSWAFDQYATLLCRMSTLAAHEVSA